MSSFVPATIACPACGRTERVELAESLNVSRTPSHRAAVLDEGFQRFTCEACGTAAVHMLDFLYVDFAAKLFVGVMRPELQPTWAHVEWEADDAYRTSMGADAPEHAQPIGRGFTVRTVFGLPALREKVIGHELRVDDVELELVKLRLLLAGSGAEAGLDPGRVPRLVSGDSDALLLRWPDGTELDIARSALDETADRALEPVRQLLSEGSWVDVGRVLAKAAT